VRMWDVSAGVELKELKCDRGWVNSVAFSSNDMQIVFGLYDNSVQVWDVSTGVVLKELKHTTPVHAVVFLSNGKQILSGSDDSVCVWDASTGVVLKELKCHTVLLVASSSNGKKILSGSYNSLQVWDALTGLKLKEIKGQTNFIFSAALSSDGMRIVSGSDDNFVRVWDASTGVELKRLKGHTGIVTSVAFSNDGMQIVSCSSDNSVRVWDVSMIGCENFDWILADNNWIISSQGQNHLMWVPPDANLVQGFNIVIISNSGFTTVDFNQSMIGDDWAHCYTP